MPIQLPDPILEKCFSLINIGSLLQLFDITTFTRVLEINQKLHSNELFIQDLRDIQRLCNAIRERQEINDFLREDVKCLSTILDLFIEVSAAPAASCARWV